ncbi:microcystin dependent protein, putative [Rhodobacteraceae bacterium HTCC2150]|nr:microcystin dependent protein, putative [Rhodobacteraceae bacterium HTCC2150]
MKKLLLSALASLGFLAPMAPTQVNADAYIGQLMNVGYGFCPRTWTEASGQILAISSNQTLFSLLGTTYGGDGRTSFGLPDLRSRNPVHVGSGPGVNNVT